MNNNKQTDIEILAIDIEMLKDRQYNLEQYMKSVTRAITEWADKVTKLVDNKKEKEEVTNQTMNEVIRRCETEGKTLEISKGKAYIR